jgi:protein gp37
VNDTKISWTELSWNPTHGCHKVDEGCRHCYAEALSLRRGWTEKPWTKANAPENVILKPHKLNEPYKLKEPTRVFVNSMSDLGHELIPPDYLAQIFAVMADLPQHTFQCLTKRPRRFVDWPGPWTENIWLGATVADRKGKWRLDALRETGAAVRFISFEPLLEDLGELDLTGIHWAIAGGESGPGYRPLDHAWARAIRDQCVEQGVAFFFKQDAAPRTEMRPYLNEADGSRWKWEQFPDAMVPPWPYGKEPPPAPDEGWETAPMLARETAAQPAQRPVYRRAADGQMRPALF